MDILDYLERYDKNCNKKLELTNSKNISSKNKKVINTMEIYIIIRIDYGSQIMIIHVHMIV